MDSIEEKWFGYYLDELVEAGYIRKVVYQPESFQLSEDVYLHALSSVNGKVNDVRVKVLSGHKYTADWRIEWNKKAEGIFYWQSGKTYNGHFAPYSKRYHDEFIPFIVVNGVTYVDVKGGFVGRSNTSGTTYPLNVKWTMKDTSELVQKIVVSLDDKGIFYKTFTPSIVVNESVYKTSKHGKYAIGDSKIKYEVKTLDEYVRIKKSHNIL